MTAENPNPSLPDSLAAAGHQWVAAAMPELGAQFEACAWNIGAAPSLASIQGIDLCGLQLLVVLRRRTQAHLGQCEFQDIPECVRDAAYTAGLNHWLGIEQERSA